MTSEVSNPSSSLIQRYYPSLDGLRAVAILLVFIVHFLGSGFDFAPFRWGWIGVDIFFVLSGFLITGILVDTVGSEGYFKGFYARRALRIFPLYYAVFACLLLVSLLPGIDIAWNWFNLSYLAYLGNLLRLGGELGLHPKVDVVAYQIGARSGGLVYFAHLWSLSVEEQFYLVWPAIVWLVRSRRALMGICVAVFVSEPLIRLGYLVSHPFARVVGELYLTTWFRIDTLLVGAFLALQLRHGAYQRRTVRAVARGLVILPIIVLFATWPLLQAHPKTTNTDPLIDSFGFSLIALMGAGLLLLTLDPETWLAKALKRPTLIWIGRRSYGLYLWHGLVLGILTDKMDDLHRLHLEALTFTVLSPAVSVGLAWISFRYIEAPFLRMKPKLSRPS